jgi:hypothetical protein
MKTEILHVLDNTAKTILAIDDAFRVCGPRNHNNDILILAALTPPVLAAFAVTEIGGWAIDELRRQARIREKRPASPSLRGTPTPTEIAADWADRPRTLSTCLRLGSRLADLDPTLDHTLVRRQDAHGRLVIRSRKGGIKGWLEDRRVPVGYSTVMRYKKLAQRLRQVLSLDDRLPLEWVLSGLPADQTLPADLAAPFATAHRLLAKLVRENPTLKSLSRAAEKALGIVRLVTVRKVPARRFRHGTKQRKNPINSVISQHRQVNASPDRVEATKGLMAKLLQARNLSGPALHLQNRLKAWLSKLPLSGAS